MAKDLVQRNVSVIFSSGGTVTTVSAKEATKTIPIVFLTGTDPILAGLVTNLSRPDSNLTGLTQFASALTPKRLDAGPSCSVSRRLRTTVSVQPQTR